MFAFGGERGDVPNAFFCGLPFLSARICAPALPTGYSLEIGVAGRRWCPCHGATGEETLLVLGQCVQILTAFSFGPD